MFWKYRMHYEDGSDAGQAEYAVPIKPGETIWTRDGDKLRVLAVVPVEETDSPFDGLLKWRRLGRDFAAH
jgi:hypothetical protein